MNDEQYWNSNNIHSIHQRLYECNLISDWIDIFNDFICYRKCVAYRLEYESLSDYPTDILIILLERLCDFDSTLYELKILQTFIEESIEEYIFSAFFTLYNWKLLGVLLGLGIYYDFILQKYLSTHLIFEVDIETGAHKLMAIDNLHHYNVDINLIRCNHVNHVNHKNDKIECNQCNISRIEIGYMIRLKIYIFNAIMKMNKIGNLFPSYSLLLQLNRTPNLILDDFTLEQWYNLIPAISNHLCRYKIKCNESNIEYKYSTIEYKCNITDKYRAAVNSLSRLSWEFIDYRIKKVQMIRNILDIELDLIDVIITYIY